MPKAPHSRKRLHSGTDGNDILGNFQALKFPRPLGEGRNGAGLFPPALGAGPFPAPLSALLFPLPLAGERTVGAPSHHAASASTSATTSDATRAGQVPAPATIPNGLDATVPPGTSRTAAAAGTPRWPITRIGKAAINSRAAAHVVVKSSRTDRGGAIPPSAASAATATASPTARMP